MQIQMQMETQIQIQLLLIPRTNKQNGLLVDHFRLAIEQGG